MDNSLKTTINWMIVAMCHHFSGLARDKNWLPLILYRDVTRSNFS